VSRPRYLCFMTRRKMVDVGLVETLLSSWMSDSCAVYGSDFEDKLVIYSRIDQHCLQDFCGLDRTWLHQCYRARPNELSIYRQAFDSAWVAQSGMLRILRRSKISGPLYPQVHYYCPPIFNWRMTAPVDLDKPSYVRSPTEISRAASVPHTNRGSVP